MIPAFLVTVNALMLKRLRLPVVSSHAGEATAASVQRPYERLTRASRPTAPDAATASVNSERTAAAAAPRRATGDPNQRDAKERPT